MDAPDELATNIAQNIGYMPMVNKAGEMGGGFMDFLGSLLGGGKSQAPAPAAAKQEPAGSPNFLSDIWKSISSGAQSTADAARDDWGNIQEGQMPKHLTKDAWGLLGMTGSPNMGNAQIPAMRTVSKVFDPQAGWTETLGKAIPGGDWPTIFARQGGLGPFLQYLMKRIDSGDFR